MCTEQTVLYRDNISTIQRLPAWNGFFGSLTGLAALWLVRARQRRALAHLDDHLLRDIGIGGIEAGQEARKPFWRA